MDALARVRLFIEHQRLRTNPASLTCTAEVYQATTTTATTTTTTTTYYYYYYYYYYDRFKVIARMVREDRLSAWSKWRPGSGRARLLWLEVSSRLHDCTAALRTP